VTVSSTPLQQQQPAVSLAALTAAAKASGAKRYTATLQGPQGASCVPGEPVEFVWTLYAGSSSKDTPVRDLHEYYGAPMHLAIVSADLDHIAHEHGSSAGTTSSSDGARQAAPARAAATATISNSNNAPPRDAASAATGNAHAGHAGRRRLAQHAGHGTHGAAQRFGPALKTRVAFPSRGEYLLVGQVVRGGDELLLLPLRVSCGA
jgi:hypothetical protein